jgi:glutamyl-tRNA reductase
MTNHESAEAAGVLLAALQERAAQIREAELERARRRLGMLAPEQGQAVETLLSAIVDRMLQAPRTAIHQLECEGRARSCASAVRSVFGLADGSMPL